MAVTYTVGNIRAVRDATVMPVEGRQPYGYYFAELPPDATGITATAYDGAGTALESDAYGAAFPQPPLAPPGRLERYEGTPWATGAHPPVMPAGGGRMTSFEVALAAPRRTTPAVGYSARATSDQPSTGCRSDADVYFPVVPVGAAFTIAHLQPAGEGAHLGWCPGRYRGAITRAPANGERRVVERFSFRVLP